MRGHGDDLVAPAEHEPSGSPRHHDRRHPLREGADLTFDAPARSGLAEIAEDRRGLAFVDDEHVDKRQQLLGQTLSGRPH